MSVLREIGRGVINKQCVKKRMQNYKKKKKKQQKNRKGIYNIWITRVW